jgi:hypothetical protein
MRRTFAGAAMRAAVYQSQCKKIFGIIEGLSQGCAHVHDLVPGQYTTGNAE